MVLRANIVRINALSLKLVRNYVNNALVYVIHNEFRSNMIKTM